MLIFCTLQVLRNVIAYFAFKVLIRSVLVPHVLSQTICCRHAFVAYLAIGIHCFMNCVLMFGQSSGSFVHYKRFCCISFVDESGNIALTFNA